MQLQDIKTLELLKQIAKQHGLNLSIQRDFDRAEQILASQTNLKVAKIAISGTTKKQGLVRVDTIKAF